MLVLGISFSANSISAKSYKILIVTGGHDFEKELFYNVFDKMKGIEYSTVVQPEANQVYNSDLIGKFDAIVFYDMVQDITDQQKESFINMLNDGKGIVFLHHSLVSYEKWDEFGKIIGGRYHVKPVERNGESIPASTYVHDQYMPVAVVDRYHPVTVGIKDFVIRDEAYGSTEVFPFVHPLLTTDHPENGKIIAWTNKYGKSRIVFLQLGHDHQAWENKYFNKLVMNSIKWVSKK